MQQIVDRYLPTISNHEVDAAGQRILQRLREELKKHDTSLRSLYGDGWSIGPVDDREFRVLTALSQLGESPVVNVHRTVENWAGGFTLLNVHFLLDGLVVREFASRRSEPTDNGPEHFYQITGEGERALRRAHAENKQLVRATEDPAIPGACTERPS